jgi:subtilase family serine protease
MKRATTAMPIVFSLRFANILGVFVVLLAPVSARAVTKSQKAVCPSSSTMHCHAHVVTDASSGSPLASLSYSDGLTPADLHDAYKLPAIPRGSFAFNGQTIAIVDAYDNPNVAGDLRAYRQQFGLPNCVGGDVGCLFVKLNESGQATPLPKANAGWGEEIDLDVQMAAAACPACKIILIEATTPSISNLEKAVDEAASLGASSISNSYGGSETSSENSYAKHYNHLGIAITASSGDSGYGVEFPAASAYLTAVGGTTLNHSTSARG